jgi:hypothetical protein
MILNHTSCPPQKLVAKLVDLYSLHNQKVVWRDFITSENLESAIRRMVTFVS